MEQRALLSAVSWTGAVSSDWDTAGNWSDDAVPGASDDVTINVATNTPVTHAENFANAINSLTSAEPLSISAGSLSIASASTISGGLTVGAGGSLYGNGALTVSGLVTTSGNLELEGGGTGIGGTLDVLSGATLDMAGAWSLDNNSSIEGAGTMDFQGDDTITLNGTYNVTGATLLNGSPTVDLDGPVQSVGASLTVHGGTLNVNGPYSASASPISTVTVGIASGPATVNFGPNDVTATTVTTTAGSVLNVAGTLTVSGLLNLDGGTVSGSGVVDANGGIVMGNPQDYYDGPVTLDGCTLNNAAGQTLTDGLEIDFEDGAVLNNAGTFTSTHFIAGDDNPFAGGFEQGSGAASTFDNTGSFVVPTGSSGFNVDGVAFDDDGGTVDVQAAKLMLTGGGTSTGGAFTILSGATLEISSSGGGSAGGYTFDAKSSLSGGGALTIEVAAATPVVFLGTSTLAGTTDIISGTLEVDGSQHDSTIQDGGTVSGHGTVGPISFVSGTLSPGNSPTVTGILTVDGNATFGNGDEGTFDLDLNGTTPSTGYDQLNVNGTVDLSGAALDASLGFTPASGETFSIITSTAPIEGTFNGLAQGASVTIGGVPFTISYTGGASGDDVVLTAAGGTTTTSPATTGTTLKSSANPATFGQTVTFTADVSSTTGTATGDVTFTVDGHAQTPVALAVVNGVDQASFTTSSLSPGSHTIGATYNGGPGFDPSPATPLTQTVNPTVTTPPPPSTDGPRITLVQRYGYHMLPTSIVLTFDQALDAVTAEDAADYRITGPSGQTIAIKKAVYDPADLTVKLYPAARINIHHTYKLIVDGTSPHGLTNTFGQLLDGADTGSPDSNYVGLLTWRNLVLDPLPKGWHASSSGGHALRPRLRHGGPSDPSSM
jgi:fibronectin-binding autotransporter adhesin